MNQSSFGDIYPGARVLAGDTALGTVESLEPQGGQPDRMIVRSQDGQQSYSIPLMLVGGVDQGGFGAGTVRLTIGADALTPYVVAPTGGAAQVAQVAQVAPAPPVTPGGEWTGARADDTLVIPLAAEELVAEKQPVVLGRVRVHKGVETVSQSLTVPVYHEEAIVEHIPVDQYDPNAPTGPNDLIIPVTEEQIVVEKRSVVKEYIRIRKTVVAQEQHVSDVVRREFVELTEQRQQAPADLTLLHYEGGNGTATTATTATTTGGTTAPSPS